MIEIFPVQHSYLIPLLPLVAAAVVLCLGAKVLKGASHWPIWLGVGGAAVLSLWMLVAGVTAGEGARVSTQVPLFTWIEAGGFKADAAFWIDPLTMTMLGVVTGIGFLIMVFAAGYMKGETGYWRFFASLGLFIFAMTVLVLADNLVLLFLGWEGVGLASYLLIGFYSDQPIAREAAKKAFIVNRIGDLGLAIGIMLIYLLFGTVSFFGTQAQPGFLAQITSGGAEKFVGWQATAYAWIPYLLLLGCFGKSAQFPLFTWLPDAMAGPTPVSALIHAATMVTAGIYLVVRCAGLFYGAPNAMLLLASVACFTSLLTATIAFRQYDLKRVFAYSTVSQLGFMFVAAACLVPVAAIFHLMTHAFFKALLFLGSGVVMHAMAGELDLRKLSGLKKQLPVTRWLMLIGCAALAGFPLTSGFFSKDEILVGAFNYSPILGGLMLLCALMTAYYTFRLYFRVFEGPELHHGELSAGMTMAADTHAGTADDAETDHGHRHDQHAHDDHGSHEPLILIAPLVLLAIGALAAGYVNWPKHAFGHFLEGSISFQQAAYLAPHAEHGISHGLVMGLSAGAAILGIVLAYYFHLANRGAIAGISNSLKPIVKVLEGRYWIDEIYNAVVVKPLWVLGRISDFIDLLVNAVVIGVSFVPKLGAYGLSLATQRGYVQGYAVAMLIGLAIVLLLMFPFSK